MIYSKPVIRFRISIHQHFFHHGFLIFLFFLFFFFLFHFLSFLLLSLCLSKYATCAAVAAATNKNNYYDNCEYNDQNDHTSVLLIMLNIEALVLRICRDLSQLHTLIFCVRRMRWLGGLHQHWITHISCLLSFLFAGRLLTYAYRMNGRETEANHC